jgi:parallel beta-helix repeat protein
MQIQTARAVTISGNVITDAAYAGILLDGIDTASVTGNTVNGATVQGIQLAGAMGTSTIDGNTISNANTSLGADRGAIRLYGTAFTGATTITNNTISASHNGIAIRNGENIAGKVITLSGNTISVGTGSSVYHGGTGELDFTGANTVGSIAVASASLADLFTVSGTISDGMDVAGKGLVRIKSGNVYVISTGSIELGIAAASAGDIVNVQAGNPVVLTAEITKNVTFTGTFAITSASIPTGPTATAVLSSFTSRGVVGSTTYSAITSGMSADQLNAVGTNYAYFNGGVTGDLTLTSAQSAAQISSILAGAADGSAYVVATGMGDDQLNAVAAAATKVATDGITGTMIVTSGIVDANLAALLGKASEAGAVVEVNASGMTDGELSTVVLAGARVDEAYNLSLDNGQSAGEITALLGKSVAAASTGKAMALADATTMDATKLNALGGSSAKLAANGITGSVALSSGVTDANFTNLFGKIALGADVRVDGTGLGASTITIVSANIAKVDSAFALFVTNAQSVTELGNVLGVSDASSATANATGMDSLAGGKLATLANNYTKFTASGISGTFTIGSGLTPTQIANLLSKVDFGTGGSSFLPPASITIDATGMSNEQLSTIATSVASAGSSANQAAVFDIVNLSLTDSQNATEMAILLNSTLANEATVDATGMDASQLAALGNAPAAVDQITGTVTITADLTAAQIAAIMGNTATTAQVTIDSTGMSPEQQAAVLSTAVMVVGADATVATGNLFTVEVDISGLSTAAVGVQARIGYDASRIEFVADANGDGDTDSIGGTDMPTTIFVNPGIGTVSFATGVDTGGDGTGFTAGNAARLTFRALVPFCGATDLVWLVPSDATFTNRASTSAALAIPFTGTNFSNVTSLNNLQLAGVPGADTSVAADAGTTAGAAIAEPTVTASNNCVPSVTVVRTITFPNATTSSIWPARFPVGVSTVTWTATDAGGNVATATRTYTVANYQLATIDVNLIGGINPGITFDQVVRIRLSSGDVVTATVPFTGNNGAVIDAQIPVRSDYTCITVKDAGHTVADAQTLSVSGTKYVASGSFQLISGDSNDDNVVDILDFGAFVSDRGAGKTPASRSNFDRNPVVNNSDFSFISLNFLVTGDSCGGGNFDGDAPLTRVSIKELRRAGLGHLEEADINMDGWLDQTDMALAMQGQYRKDFADHLDAADEVPMTNW